MLGFLRYFKKAAKLKGKVKRPGAPGEPAEQIDRSIYRIGIFGHKDTGKTVFLTSVYAFFKDSSELQLLAMGETQVYLEENFNLMKGTGDDQVTGEKIRSRKFPEPTSDDKKLSFSAQLGKTMNVSLEMMDYSGKNLYLDSSGGMPQNLADFFELCDCVLFFIDPDGINNEGELTRRVASFTRLIEQLSGSKKRLNVPVGLVVTKADELTGFKSSLQSSLVGSGSGYIKGYRFNDLLSGVVKQRYLSDYPEWMNTLKALLIRFQSFFNPLIKNTLDYQVFFVSSIGNVPSDLADGAGKTGKAPPRDFRPLGVNQPIEWALKRIRACRRALVFGGILKWVVFISLLITLFVSFFNIYNKMKINSLVAGISNLKLDRLEDYSQLASAFNSYSNNIFVKLFFSDFRRVSNEKYNVFAGISGDDWIRSQFQQFDLMKDSTAVLLSIADNPGSDTELYKKALSSISSILTLAEDLERTVKTQGYSTAWMTSDISSWREALGNMPTAEDHDKVSKLIGEYSVLKQDFNENLSNKNYVYLLDISDNRQFPGKLSEFKGKLDEFAEIPGVDKYAEKVDNYLNLVAELERKGSYIYFTVSGADPGVNGFYIAFGQQPGFPEGAIDASSRERIRIPAKNDIEVKLHQVNTAVATDNCIIPAGFEILSWNNKKLCFENPNLNVKLRFDLDEFDSSLRSAL
ncbi:MAG: hypothetical protein JSU85_09755 [Candidatus Zixiibacteriota bacterium]|nr:MAG: hypothetical protein JSU85_09755 [candidate division Zixibacteria bacterium]